MKKQPVGRPGQRSRLYGLQMSHVRWACLLLGKAAVRAYLLRNARNPNTVLMNNLNLVQLADLELQRSTDSLHDLYQATPAKRCMAEIGRRENVTRAAVHTAMKRLGII